MYQILNLGTNFLNFPHLDTSRLIRSHQISTWTNMSSKLLDLVWKRCGFGPSKLAGNSAYQRPPNVAFFTPFRTGSERVLNGFRTGFERVRVSTGTPTGLNALKCWLFNAHVRIGTGKFRVRTGLHGFVRVSQEITNSECKIIQKCIKNVSMVVFLGAWPSQHQTWILHHNTKNKTVMIILHEST